MKNNWEQFILDARENITSIKDLEQWFIDESKEIISHNFPEANRGLKFINFRLMVTHHDKISNYHCAPHNGVTNWGGKEGKPTGYPGYGGRIWIVLSRDPENFGSSSINGTAVHIGTGGYGWCDGAGGFSRDEKVEMLAIYPKLYKLSYDVKIFDTDFPAIFTTEKLST